MTEYRQIRQQDNEVLATIIRRTLEEFHADVPGTVYFDATTDALYELFQTPGSVYFVALENGAVMGGCGIFPTQGLPGGVCELVKMYLIPAARGKGIGKALLNKCTDWAKSRGYKKIYLETMPQLSLAIPLYERSGFRQINEPLGNTGHFSCQINMIREI